MLPQQYCLRWKYHHSNLQTMFSHLLDRGCFCDVTLACEGQLIRAHRVVLCACSTFFDQVLTNYASERDPIIIIKDVTFADVKCLIEFMYKGEINVEHASLASLLKTADDLKIKGLAEVSWRDEETDPVMMDHHQRMQENIPHNEQRSPPRNYHDVRSPASPMNPSVANNRIASRMPMLAPMPSSSGGGEYVGPKRKRGRPPLDDSYDVFSTPKISHIVPSCELMYPEVRTRLDSPPPQVQEQPQQQHQQQQQQQHNSPRDHNEPMREASPEPQEWSHQNVEHENTETQNSTDKSISQSESIPGPGPEYYHNNESQSHDHENEPEHEITVEDERKYSVDQEINELGAEDQDQDDQINNKLDEAETQLTSEELAQWDDVVKMDAYLATGRRPQFWEEPFTKRVLDAIKNKKLEMKKAAKLLGVSYGTLYGRYREVYGCLKHPYRPNTTIMNRYDLVWPHKRSDIKIRDLKDVWMR